MGLKSIGIGLYRIVYWYGVVVYWYGIVVYWYQVKLQTKLSTEWKLNHFLHIPNKRYESQKTEAKDGNKFLLLLLFF